MATSPPSFLLGFAVLAYCIFVLLLFALGLALSASLGVIVALRFHPDAPASLRLDKHGASAEQIEHHRRVLQHFKDETMIPSVALHIFVYVGTASMLFNVHWLQWYCVAIVGSALIVVAMLSATGVSIYCGATALWWVLWERHVEADCSQGDGEESAGLSTADDHVMVWDGERWE